MIRYRYLLGLVASFAMLSAPVEARRTAIDQDPDGNATNRTLSGYCDIDGDECDQPATLGYKVSFDGGKNFTDLVNVTGNGLVTFGGLTFEDGSTVWDTPLGGTTLRDVLVNQYDPALTDYQRNLVSAGQFNVIDSADGDGSPGFYQSAKLNIVNDVIKAEWYICRSPQDCRTNVSSLTLTPTAAGFRVLFDLRSNPSGQAPAYVMNGEQFAMENGFFLPAIFSGLTSAVPEPASWAMMIAGFGLVGGTLRRRSTRQLPRLA